MKELISQVSTLQQSHSQKIDINNGTIKNQEIRKNYHETSYQSDEMALQNGDFNRKHTVTN